MGNEFKGEAAHSADYFGDTRDHWWNRDYLALLAQRWRLSEVHEALDVGCGVGHWGMLLGEHLARDAWMIGVDREPRWVAKAAERAAARGLGPRYRYQQASAERLPFGDDAFDLVTCQTVLIHVADAVAVLREMRRVLRPGGILAVCEPNNLAHAVMADATTFTGPVDELVAMVRLQLLCERGKAALGEGDNSIGQLLPAMFTDAGLVDVTVSMNDRAVPLVAPYAEAWQRPMVEELIDFAARDYGLWSHDETKRYYLAGAGAEADFAGHWALALRNVRRAADEARAGTYRLAGGVVGYCVSGRKPRA
jgi:SAM-dependent methyltransferase